MSRPSLPAGFIRERTRLTWREILHGIDGELLAPGAAVDFAIDELVAQDNPSPALLELSDTGEGEPTRALVEQLAGAEPGQAAEAIRDKWLYLVLAWVHEHEGSYADPLGAVEEVYADFGYPETIQGFVRYMPMEGPDLGSRELNEQRLYERWKQYLDDAAVAHRR